MPTSHDLKGLMKFLERNEWKDCFGEVLDDHLGPVLDASGMEFADLADVVSNFWAMTLWGVAFEDFLTPDSMFQAAISSTSISSGEAGKRARRQRPI